MSDSSTQATVAVRQLRAHLDRVGVDGMCGLLREAWPDLEGSDQEGMAPYKLTEDRIEKPAWEPPVLTFVIERHGGTAQGSSRADLQTWVVDLDAGTANPEITGRRQLRPMSPRLDVRAIART